MIVRAVRIPSRIQTTRQPSVMFLVESSFSCKCYGVDGRYGERLSDC